MNKFALLELAIVQSFSVQGNPTQHNTATVACRDLQTRKLSDTMLWDSSVHVLLQWAFVVCLTIGIDCRLEALQVGMWGRCLMLMHAVMAAIVPILMSTWSGWQLHAHTVDPCTQSND